MPSKSGTNWNLIAITNDTEEKQLSERNNFEREALGNGLSKRYMFYNVRKSYFVLLKFISIQFKYLNTKLDDGDKSWNFRDILVLPKHSHIRFWFYKMLPKKQIKFKLSKPISLIKMLSSCGWCPEKQLNPKLVNCCCLGTESFIHNFGCTSKIEQKGKIKKP